MGHHRAGQRAHQGADYGVGPLPRVEQLAPVEGEAGGGRAKGRTQLVGAQHQVRRQAGGEQRRGGEQAATAGNGIDKAGNEGDEGKNGEGGQIYAEFERHGIDLFRRGAEELRERSVSYP